MYETEQGRSEIKIKIGEVLEKRAARDAVNKQCFIDTWIQKPDEIWQIFGKIRRDLNI